MWSPGQVLGGPDRTDENARPASYCDRQEVKVWVCCGLFKDLTEFVEETSSGASM